MVEANSKATKNRIDTDAEARTIKSKAKADGDAIIIAAKAKKTALELKGQGEAEYARLLESTKLGNIMSIMQVQSDALKNKKQVAYIPHLPDILNTNGIFQQNDYDNKK